MSWLKFQLLTLACSLVMAPLCHAADASSKAVPGLSTPSRIISATLGEPGIVLRRLADGSTAIETGPNVSFDLRNDLFFFPDSRLIKIGSVYARDKSIDELIKLLPGPLNSTIEVTLVQGDKLIARVLTRYPRAMLYGMAQVYSPLLNVSNFFTNGGRDTEDLVAMGKDHHLTGSNLAAAPYFIAATTCPKFMALPLFAEPARALPDALDFYAQTGMFDKFDAAAAKTIELSEANNKKCSDQDAELLAKCAAVLSQNGGANKARIIYDRLCDVLPSLSNQNKIRVLLGRAQLLGKSDGKALEDYKQVAEYCAQPGRMPHQLLLETLQTLVDYGVKNNNFEMAETAQSHIVDLQRGSQGSCRHLQFQEYVGALLKLSDIYEQFGNSAKSQSTLQQAVLIYSDKLNAQELMVLERRGSPCLSDVEMRLACSYARTNQCQMVSAQVALAEKLVSEALGVDCRTAVELRKIKALLVKNNAIPFAEVSKEFTSLFALADMSKPSVAVVDHIADAQLARLAYDTVASDPAKASSLVDMLLAHELAKSTHCADGITRLINLIKLVQQPLSSAKAVDLLKQLDKCFEQPGTALSLNRVYQLSEIALLSNEDSVGASPSWTSLENILKDLEVAQYHHGERSAEDEERSRLRNLLGVSYVYAFLGEPKKALRLVNYAMQKYPGALELDRSPIAYEAILELLQGNMVEAKKYVDNLKTPDGSNYDYSRMFGVLGITLSQTGHSDLALKILPPHTSEKSRVVDTLAYRRAIVLYQLGRYSDALTELGDGESDGSYLGDEIFNLRFLRAELFAKIGQPDKAILAYAQVGGSGSASSLAFTRAVELANTLPSLSPNSIKALVAASSHQHSWRESGNNTEILKSVLELAEKNNFVSNDLDSLKSWILNADLMSGKVEQVIPAFRQRAQSAEETPGRHANFEWADLARIYLGTHQYADGVAAMLHALTIDSGESISNQMYHPGNVRGTLGFTFLVRAKKYREAEAILKQSIASHKTAGFSKSAFIEKSFLAELFIEEGNYSEAKKWAEILLQTFSDDQGICVPRSDSMRAYLFYSVVDKFTEQKQFVIAESLLDQATKIQLALVGPRNPLFIENYQSYAKLLQAQHKLLLAEAFARKALDLENWIGGSKNSGRISAVLLASILRKEGKSFEADQAAVSPSPLAKNPPDLQKLYNISILHSHSAVPEFYANTAEGPLKKALAEAVASDGGGSIAALKALDELTRFFVQQKRYDEAEKTQLYQLKILDLQYGKCAVQKFGCMLNLAEIYLLDNKPSSALQFADQITRPPLEDSFRGNKNRLRLAAVLLSLGRRDKALELARQDEKFLIETSGGYNNDEYLDRCLHFMQRAGAVDDINALTKVKHSMGVKRYPSGPDRD